MKITGRYSPGLYAGVTGILALVAINAFTLPNSLQQASERERLTAEAQIEQTKAEQTKKVADAYAKNGIANFEQLIVNDYRLNNNPPHIDWQRTVDPSKKSQNPTLNPTDRRHQGG